MYCAWLAMAISLLACMYAYGKRIRAEEAALEEQLPEELAAYCRRTPYRLTPGIC